MVDDEERQARLALACVIEPGDLRLKGLLARFEPAEVWASLTRAGADNAWGRRARALDVRTVELLARKHGLRFIVPGDDEWPPQLAVLAACEPVQESGGAPIGLWVRGERSLAGVTATAVALVGSRASTAYGDRVSADLGAALAAEGVTVVSGGAYGIDAAAHRGAIAENGPTVAVLAGGLDEFYPRAHANLLGEVASYGAVVSEVPPGEHPTRKRFLVRNRLIAALAAGTVVVEAGVRSGARNTVTWANACGRVVMAVPGPIGNPTSYTPHRLIREGEAVLVTGLADVMEVVGPVGESQPIKPSQPRLLDLLSDSQRAVYEALPSRGSRATGDLSLRAGLTVRDTLVALNGLCDAGLAGAADDGGWRLGRIQDRPVPSSQQEGGGGDG